MQEEKLSYSETCRRFEVNSRDRIKSWERICLEEGPEGFAVERRGCGSTGRPKKLPKDVEEDLLTTKTGGGTALAGSRQNFASVHSL